MDSRMKYLVNQKLKKNSQLGNKIKDPGAHLYHAASGVFDGHPTTEKKNAKMKKAFARLRAKRKDHYDEGTHSYMISRDSESVY